MVLQPTCTKNTSCTSEVILASILLGLKTSKDFTDITESSIRLATSEEAKALSQVKVVMLTDGDANTQEYGKIDGGSDTLTVTPTVSWDGFTFSPTHAADTSRTESDATKHWNPCANHTDCGKRFNEDDHSWGSDGKCTVCSYLCSHASGYNYTYVDANNHSKTCTTCGKVENEPHTQKTAATCTAAATCSKCNHNYGPALGHTLTYTPSVVATCKVEGHIEYWHCSKCNNYYADKDAKTELSADAVKPALNPTNHVRTEIKSIKAPTCTETGYTGDKWCLDCNTKIKDGSSIPALGHTFTTGEGDNTKPNYVPAGTGRYGITIERVKCVNCDAYDETNANAVKASLPINVSLRVQKDAASISNPPAKVQFIFALYKAGDERPIVNGTFAETTGNANETLTGTGVFEGKPANDVTTAENNLLDALPTENTPWTVKQTSLDRANWTIDRTEYKIAFVQSGDSLILRVLDNAPETDPTTPGGEVEPTQPVSDIVAFTNIYKAVKQDDPPTPTPVIPDGPKHTNRRYPAKPAASTDTKKPDGVTSARTFDAGVALYVGMSVLSLTGTALVIGKKKEF